VSLQTAEDGTFTGPDAELDPRATLVAKIPRDGGDDVALRPIGPQEPTAASLSAATPNRFGRWPWPSWTAA
jgi:hypothetical protein